MDTFFSKDFYGNTYNPGTMFANENIVALIKFIWSKKNENTAQI